MSYAHPRELATDNTC